MALASCSAGAPAWKSSLAKTVPVLEDSWEGLAQGPAQASGGPSIGVSKIRSKTTQRLPSVGVAGCHFREAVEFTK